MEWKGREICQLGGSDKRNMYCNTSLVKVHTHIERHTSTAEQLGDQQKYEYVWRVQSLSQSK